MTKVVKSLSFTLILMGQARIRRSRNTEVIMEEKSKPIDKQRDNNRDEKGRFVPGYNPGTGFKPGQSGNPAGRPKNELCITAMLRNQLDEIADITLKDGTKNTEKTWAELIVEAVLRGAATGDGRLTKELLDRLEGKVADKFHGEVKVYRTVEE